MKTRVDVEKVIKLHNEWQKYHNLNPDEVDIYENGKLIEVNQEVKDNWKFCGLGLSYFIVDGIYKLENLNEIRQK